MRRLANVQQGTIKPLIPATMTPGTWVSTDEYDLYRRLEQWGDAHENVCHSDGADARDDEGDGLCAMHVHTMEGLWSRLRSWRRPHRGISQEHVPLSVGVFACVHTVRRRGKALLGALLELLLTELPGIHIEPKKFTALETSQPWWEQIVGTFENDRIYDEAMKRGRHYRQSLRPKTTTRRTQS